MKIRNNKNLIGFLKALINLSLILVVLFFQFFIPINSDASCSGGQPICPSGQSYICPSGQAPCCLFSDESGCSNGLSCFGGIGFCGTSTSTTSSTSSTTGGVTMCGGDNTPNCPSGQNYICPSGGAPCCIQFSDEAGCSFGLSCFGGQGFCGTTSTTSSTSSTTGGVTMCGGDNTPNCPSGQNYICPSGAAPCCIQFSDEAGCSYGLSCFGGQGFCGTSSTTSSTSSTTGGVNMCGGDNTPDCPSGQNYICPSGEAPCCIQFSDEAGCSTGLSCYGGRGFCGTSSTSSTSSTTGGVVMCGGDITPDCPSGQNYICPSGQAPCCIQFSDEAGCSTGLSCYGGRGFCGTSSTSSTSSTTGGVVMCGGDITPDCPSGQNYICPSGQAPCCIQFSDEAGCSTGLSCYGGRGFCGTSSTSSTSSTTGGVTMCGGDNTPDCPSGQNYICPSGQAPCCIQFSDEAGCSTGLSCYGGRGFCGTSSTSSTSSTTGGVVMCGGDITPDCPSGQNYICPSGAAPCCIQFSDEAGCSYGLSCFGGQGFCGTSSTTSSTSSTTGGVVMCGGDTTPDCPSGQNYICPSGQAPCCIQFSDEAGCSTGLSCYGGRGFCATSSTSSSTSSTTGGVVMCGGDTTPDCPSGQNYICPSGQAPCCIQFSDEAGCSTGLSCYGGRGFCATSSTSSSTSSSSSGGSSSSSSSSGSLVPYCSGGQVMCDSGTPTCPSGLVPDCGSNYGLPGQFSGQGCITPSMTLFLVNSVSCTPAQRIFTPIKQVNSCEKEGSLCPAERGRFKSCREDKASCKCVCQFETKKQKVTPHCDINNTVVCSNSTRPACSKSSNIPVCLDGKLICRDRDTGAIDLVDIISCKKKESKE